MNEAAGSSTIRSEEWDRLLLFLTGRLPDEVIIRSREMLVNGETATVAQALVFAAVAHPTGITASEAALLAAALGEDVGHGRVLAAVKRVDHATAPSHGDRGHISWRPDTAL